MDPALNDRLQQLEAALLTYVERYGLTPEARDLLSDPTPSAGALSATRTLKLDDVAR